MVDEPKRRKLHKPSFATWVLRSSASDKWSKSADTALTVDTVRSSDSTELPSTTSRTSCNSDESTWPAQIQRSKQIADSTDGPKRGNRATRQPKRSFHPEIEAFLEHLASHSHRPVTPEGIFSRSTQDGGLKMDGRGIKYTPQYAARNHGEMVPTTFHALRAEKSGEEDSSSRSGSQGGMITQAVWMEFVGQQSFNQKIMYRAAKPDTKGHTSFTDIKTVPRTTKARQVEG
jgi:hypothetical protein